MNKRPINLDLTTLKFPPMAIVSILHRLSGVILFLAIPLLLWLLQSSLSSAEQFQNITQFFSGYTVKLIVFVVLAALLYHLVAGVRHILMDIGYFESLQSGRRSARAVMIISAILIILAGIWLC